MSKYLKQLHFAQAKTQYIPLQTELWFHFRGYEQPPHRRACGITNSGWLAGNRSSSSDNDLHLGQLNNSSDDLRASAAVKRPSPTSPHEGQGQAIKAEEPEVWLQVALTVSSAETTPSGCHHLGTDDSGHLRPAVPRGPQPSSRRMAAAPTYADRSPLKSSRADRAVGGSIEDVARAS
jgi:hypothetical protein